MAFRIPKRAPSTCCGGRIQMRLRRGDELYRGRVDLKEKLFWLCEGCGGWVGCHPGTDRALGVPASPELRRARSLAHAVFDRLWRNGTMTRGEAYGWLASTLRLTPEQAHMGQMDLATCRRVVNAVAALNNQEWVGDDDDVRFDTNRDDRSQRSQARRAARRATLERDGHLGLELDERGSRYQRFLSEVMENNPEPDDDGAGGFRHDGDGDDLDYRRDF